MTCPITFTVQHAKAPSCMPRGWLIPPFVGPLYLLPSISDNVCTLLLFRGFHPHFTLPPQQSTSCWGGPLVSRLLLSHRTPEPHFKGLLGLTVYSEGLFHTQGRHLAGLRRIPLHSALAFKYSPCGCISLLQLYLLILGF